MKLTVKPIIGVALGLIMGALYTPSAQGRDCKKQSECGESPCNLGWSCEHWGGAMSTVDADQGMGVSHFGDALCGTRKNYDTDTRMCTALTTTMCGAPASNYDCETVAGSP